MTKRSSVAARLSPEEQADKLRKRALELQQKGMLDELVRICKDRQDLVPLLLQHAYSLGAPRARAATQSASLTSGLSGTGTTAPAIAETENMAEDQPLPTQPVHRRGDVAKHIPRCHQTWATVPQQYFVHVLSNTEPIALSAANLRQLAGFKSRFIPKSALLDLWEFMTNLRRDDDIQSFSRDVACLLSAVRACKLRRGRPAQSLRLPPHWLRDGVYQTVLAHPGLLRVRKTLTDEVVDAPSRFASGVSDLEKVYINKNYSEQDAVLVDANGFGRVMLSTLFPNVMLMETGAAPATTKTSNATASGVPVSGTTSLAGDGGSQEDEAVKHADDRGDAGFEPPPPETKTPA